MRNFISRAISTLFFVASCWFAPSALAQSPHVGPVIRQDNSGDVIAIPWGPAAPWNALWGYGAPWNWNYGMPPGYGPPWYYANPRGGPMVNGPYITPPGPALNPPLLQPSTERYERPPIITTRNVSRKLKWPKALQIDAFAKEREAIEELLAKEGWEAKGIKLLAWRMKLKLTNFVRKIAPDDYAAAKEFLEEIEERVRR